LNKLSKTKNPQLGKLQASSLANNQQTGTIFCTQSETSTFWPPAQAQVSPVQQATLEWPI